MRGCESDDPRNTLTVRDAPAGERTVILRDAWQFGRLEDGRMVADPTRVYRSSGFEPGRESRYGSKSGVGVVG